MTRERKRQQFILGKLAQKGEMRGLDLVKESDGLLRRGTVYLTLSRMKDLGLISARETLPDTGLPLRLYSITAAGHRARRVDPLVRALARAEDETGGPW